MNDVAKILGEWSEAKRPKKLAATAASALSRAIHKLETTVFQAYFNRGEPVAPFVPDRAGKTAVLTPDGVRALRLARDFLDAVNELPDLPRIRGRSAASRFRRIAALILLLTSVPSSGRV